MNKFSIFFLKKWEKTIHQSNIIALATRSIRYQLTKMFNAKKGKAHEVNCNQHAHIQSIFTFTNKICPSALIQLSCLTPVNNIEH